MSTVPEERLAAAWSRRAGVIGFLSGVNNNTIGLLFISSAWGFFLLAGLDSVVLRTQLALPESEAVSPETFNQLFTTHGTAMMFLFAVPMLEAITMYVLPLLLGARDMAFPRMSAFTFWTFVFSGLLFYGSTLPDIVNFLLPGEHLPRLVPDVGWFAYPPLSGPRYSPGPNVDFYLLGLGAAEFAGLGAAIEIIVSVFKLRAPGMALHRIPLFAWSLLVMAFAMLFAFPAVIASSALLELERKFGLPFYDPTRGGGPLLWQHLFWIFGHPEVYIMFIPATGIVSMIVPTFARRPLAGYAFVAMAVVATGLLSFGLWVHHMFAVGLPLLGLALFGAASMMISIPSGIQVFAWTATLLNTRRVVLSTPLLFVLGFIVTFVLGGITGVMVAAVPFDWQVHDTYFVVAHFHYVLVGGVVFPIFAAFYYWLPKITGRRYDERLGRLAFWLLFVGFNLTFLPQHSAGLLGMPRRVFTYSGDLGLTPYNLASTIGSYVMALGVLVFGFSLVHAVWRGEPVGPNPWEAGTLEWSVPSPTPPYLYAVLPEVRSREPLWSDGWVPWAPERRTDGGEPARLWRETLGVTSLDARPESIVRLAGPSIWPFAAAVAVTVVSVGLLANLYVLSAAAGVAAVVFVCLWLWPSPEERTLAGVGATLGSPDLPVHTLGPASTSLWAMVLTIAALAATLAYVIFSYFYLRFGGTDWPPGGAAAPGLAAPAIASALLVASVLAVRLGEVGIGRGAQRRLLAGLGLAFALGLGFLAVQVWDYLHLGLAPRAHAYAAIFTALAGFHAALSLAGLGIIGFVAARAWRGHFDARRRLAVQNAALYWYFVAASWVATAATLYLAPRVV